MLVRAASCPFAAPQPLLLPSHEDFPPAPGGARDSCYGVTVTVVPLSRAGSHAGILVWKEGMRALEALQQEMGCAEPHPAA